MTERGRLQNAEHILNAQRAITGHKPTERHPFKGMQDPKIEAVPHPNVLFDRRVRGALARYGVDTKAIDSVVGDITRAADERQRGIGALSGVTPSEEDYEKQAQLGDVPPVQDIVNFGFGGFRDKK